MIDTSSVVTVQFRERMDSEVGSECCGGVQALAKYKLGECCGARDREWPPSSKLLLERNSRGDGHFEPGTPCWSQVHKCWVGPCRFVALLQSLTVVRRRWETRRGQGRSVTCFFGHSCFRSLEFGEGPVECEHRRTMLHLVLAPFLEFYVCMSELQLDFS